MIYLEIIINLYYLTLYKGYRMNWGKAKIIRLAIMIASLLLVASCGDKLTEAKNKAENAINVIAGKNQTDLKNTMDMLTFITMLYLIFLNISIGILRI